MLTRQLVEYQRVTYVKVDFFPIIDIMLNRNPASDSQPVTYNSRKRSVTR